MTSNDDLVLWPDGRPGDMIFSLVMGLFIVGGFVWGIAGLTYAVVFALIWIIGMTVWQKVDKRDRLELRDDSIVLSRRNRETVIHYRDIVRIDHRWIIYNDAFVEICSKSGVVIECRLSEDTVPWIRELGKLLSGRRGEIVVTMKSVRSALGWGD